MKARILNYTASIFDKFKRSWESESANIGVSYSLVFVFVISVIISYLDRADLISLGKLDNSFANPFFAIDITIC